MEKLDLKLLNHEQYTAVTAPLGPTLVVAGAGSGKTSVLTKRIAYLIEHFQLAPDRILAITFTNKASQEMNERVKKIVNTSLPWIGTFHSICIRILRRDIVHLQRNPNFKIIDEEESIVLLRDIYKERHFEAKNLTFKNAVYVIDKLKTKNITQDEFLSSCSCQKIGFADFGLKSKKDAIIFWEIYQDFLKRCATLNLLDFNDILSLTIQLLKENAEVRDYWSHRFDYVLVDEFQDTNDIQYELIKFLVKENQNIFAVGDPDQTIYSWRGAKQSIINNFDKEFANTNVVILNKNYRSSQAILNAANNLISQNPNRIHKDLVAADQNNIGVLPKVYEAANADNEGNWVAKEIANLQHQGVALNDIAILYRSNHLSRPIEQSLVLTGIRYTIFGGFKFYQRSEIKDMLAYLSAISNHDEISLRRIINTPSRRISDTTVNAILTYAHEENISFWNACLRYEAIETLSAAQKRAIANFVEIMESLNEHKNDRLDRLVVEVMKAVNYEEYLVHLEKQTAKNKMDYITELLHAMCGYMERTPNWTLNKYLQDITLFISSDDKNSKKNTVSLMTVHSSKGLEFKYVFIVGFNDGIFPSHKVMFDEEQEERRLAYVALTRAQKELFITYNTDFSFRLQQANTPSIFIDEIGKDFYQQIRLKSHALSSNGLNSDKDSYFDSKKPSIPAHFCTDSKVNNYKVGDQITHTTFGFGVIINVIDDSIVVRFAEPFGVKTLLFNHIAIRRSFS